MTKVASTTQEQLTIRLRVRALAAAGTVTPVALLSGMVGIDRLLRTGEIHGSIGMLGWPFIFALALGGIVLFMYALHHWREVTQVDLVLALLPALTCATIVAWAFLLPALRA